MKKLIAAALLGLSLAACSSSRSTPSATSTIPQAAGPPTTVKVPTARELISGFKQRGLPVGKVICYNDTTDPNNLLGRPGGYIEKCNWADKRYKQYADTADFDHTLTGGSIETFEKPGGAAQRAEYLGAFAGAGMLSTGWTFQPGNANWVLRLDAELTKAQAEQYRKAMLDQIS